MWKNPSVRALSRGLHVITAMSGTAGGATLSDIAGRVDLDRATARRILLTLESLGYVRIADKRFYLAPKVLNLGYAFLSATPLWSVSSPYLAEAAAAVAGSCSICVRDEDMLVYVARANSAKRNLAQLVEVGTRFPLYSTSAGKVLLAGMPAQRFEDYLERISAGSLHQPNDNRQGCLAAGGRNDPREAVGFFRSGAGGRCPFSGGRAAQRSWSDRGGLERERPGKPPCPG